MCIDLRHFTKIKNYIRRVESQIIFETLMIAGENSHFLNCPNSKSII